MKNVWLSKLGIGRNLPTQQSGVYGLNYAADDNDDCSNVAAVKCDKETNTDLSSNLSAANRLSRQSHDMIRGSTIRRWQTFSPTAAGATAEDLGCKVGRALAFCLFIFECKILYINFVAIRIFTVSYASVQWGFRSKKEILIVAVNFEEKNVM